MFDLQRYIDEVNNTEALTEVGLGDNLDLAFVEFANLNHFGLKKLKERGEKI